MVHNDLPPPDTFMCHLIADTYISQKAPFPKPVHVLDNESQWDVNGGATKTNKAMKHKRALLERAVEKMN